CRRFRVFAAREATATGPCVVTIGCCSFAQYLQQGIASLMRDEVADSGQLRVCCAWDQLRESLAVFDRNQWIVLTVHDGCRCVDVAEAFAAVPCDDGPGLIDHP